MDDIQPRPVLRRKRSIRFRQHFFNRTHHECQWRAKLMTDIGKERRFGTIDFRQRLSTFPARFERARIRNARRDVTGDKLEKAAVVGIQNAARACANDQEA